MGKLIAIITSGLAISTCCYSFYPNKVVFGIILVITMAFVAAGFAVEKKIKTSGEEIYNKLIYYFTKNDRKYNFESVEVTYSYTIENNEDMFELKKDYTVVSKQHDLKGVDEYFIWTLPTDDVDIKASCPNFQITGIHKEENWTHYETMFDKSYSKNKKIESGSVIKNLVPCKEKRPDTYLAHTVRRKTEILIINVKFSNNYRPKSDGTFKVSPSGVWEGKSESLKYNEEKRMFTKTIRYPRKGWRYVISWDEEKVEKS